MSLSRRELLKAQAAGIAALAANRIAVDPTLATFDFIRQRPGQLSQAFAAVADHMPPDVKRGLYAAEFDIPTL